MRARLLLSCLLFLGISCLAQTFNSQQLPASGPVVSGDFNRDGWPDLAIANSQGGDGALYVYLGIGDGNFNLASVNPGIPAAVSQIQTADINGDGNLDLVMASWGGSVVTVMLGDGKGGFSPGETITFSQGVQILLLGDMNGDGKIDIVAAECAQRNVPPCSVEVKLNKGNGTFAAGQKLALSGAPSSATLADVNGDGKLDLLVSEGKKIVIWRGIGNGTFQTATYVTPPVYCTPTSNCIDWIAGFAVADYYNNGKLHIAILQMHESKDGSNDGTDDTSTVYTYKNGGSATFTKSAAINIGPEDTIIAADLNGDRNQDILVTNGNVRADNGYFLLGNGNGSFAAPQGAPFGNADGAVAFTRDFGLTSRQDVVSWVGPYAGPYTQIDINTTPVTECPPPNSSKLQAKICAPATGKTKSTAVAIRGSGNSPAGVQRLEVWIDGAKKGESWSDQLAQTYTLKAGTHKVTVVAVDKYVGTSKSSVSITVP